MQTTPSTRAHPTVRRALATSLLAALLAAVGVVTLGVAAPAAQAGPPAGSSVAAVPTGGLTSTGDDSSGVGVDESDSETSDGADDTEVLVIIAVVVVVGVAVLLGSAAFFRRRDRTR